MGYSASDQGRALFKEQNELVRTHQDTVETSYGVEETQRLKGMLETFLKRIS